MVVIDNFGKLQWTIPLKKKISQRIKDSIKSIPIGSKRSPNWIETDLKEQISNKFSFVFLNKSNIKRNRRYIALLVVYVKRYNRIIRDPLKNYVFEGTNSNWVDINKE